MDNQTQKPLFSERLAWALTLMAVSLLLSALIAGYALTLLGVKLDQQMYNTAQASPLQIVLSCMMPLTWVLQLAALLLVIADAKRIGGTHRALAITALLLLLLSLGITVASFFISLGGVTQGSLFQIQLTSVFNAVTSLISYLAGALMVFAISKIWQKAGLLVSLALLAISGAGMSYLSVAGLSITKTEISGISMWIPVSSLDRTTGTYPVLAVLGVLGVALMLAVYAVEAVAAWKTVSNEIPETVS